MTTTSTPPRRDCASEDPPSSPHHTTRQRSWRLTNRHGVALATRRTLDTRTRGHTDPGKRHHRRPAQPRPSPDDRTAAELKAE